MKFISATCFVSCVSYDVRNYGVNVKFLFTRANFVLSVSNITHARQQRHSLREGLERTKFANAVAIASFSNDVRKNVLLRKIDNYSDLREIMS